MSTGRTLPRFEEAVVAEYLEATHAIGGHLLRIIPTGRRKLPKISLATHTGRIMAGREEDGHLLFEAPPDEASALRAKKAVDRNYRRCASILLQGGGRPMFATHDDAMIEHVLAEAVRVQRPIESYELQMLLGIRSDEQLRLAGLGHSVRVYVPFGTDWYAYFMRRLAERPANVLFLLRALVERPRRKTLQSGF